MLFGNYSATSKNSRSAVVACTLLLACSSACQSAFAQYAGGSADDSLLPPEVVPLDPASASSMSAQQAQRRAMTGGEGAVPGLVGNNGSGGMTSAKDFRNAAFNSLYGQGSLPQEPPLTQWRANQPPNLPNQAPGQNPQGAPFAMNNGNGSFAPSPYQQANNAPAPSQTLTGGTKNKNKLQNIKRAGISNTISAMAGFAGGAATAGALLRPYSFLGYGMTMGGFGVRNAFRY